MDNNMKNILIILVAIVLVLVVIRGCQRVKDVKITQKSNDDVSKLSVKVEKE
jgi:outer membrane murein-binding lipoprotein Lpp